MPQRIRPGGPRRHSRAVRPRRRGAGTGACSIRLSIISPQRVIREALSSLLRAEDGLEIIGERSPASRRGRASAGEEPDVVLLDAPLPSHEDVERVRTLRREMPKAKLLLLSTAADELAVLEALRAGAKGYVSKDASSDDLRRAIQGVHEGAVWAQRTLLVRCLRAETPAEGATPVAPPRPKMPLTAREKEILRVLAAGGTNRDVARALLISEKTVKTHLGSIFRKLQVTRRLQAVLYAIQQGWR